MNRFLIFLLTSFILCLISCDSSSEAPSFEYIDSGSASIGEGEILTINLSAKNHVIPLTITMKDNSLIPASGSDLIPSAPKIAYVGTAWSFNQVSDGISNIDSSRYSASQAVIDDGGYIVKFSTKEPGKSAVSSWRVKILTTLSYFSDKVKISYQVISNAPEASVVDSSTVELPSESTEPENNPSDPAVNPAESLRLLGGNSFTATNGTIATIALQTGSSKIALLARFENSKISINSTASINSDQPRISSVGPENSIINIDENDYTNMGLMFVSSALLYDQYGYLAKFTTYDAATRSDIPWVIKLFCAINQSGIFNIEYEVYTTATNATLSSDTSSGNLQAFNLIAEDTINTELWKVKLYIDDTFVEVNFLPKMVYVGAYSYRMSAEPELAFLGKDFTLLTLSPDMYNYFNFTSHNTLPYESGACYMMKFHAIDASRVAHLYIVTMQPETNTLTEQVLLNYRVYRH